MSWCEDGRNTCCIFTVSRLTLPEKPNDTSPNLHGTITLPRILSTFEHLFWKASIETTRSYQRKHQTTTPLSLRILVHRWPSDRRLSRSHLIHWRWKNENQPKQQVKMVLKSHCFPKSEADEADVNKHPPPRNKVNCPM